MGIADSEMDPSVRLDTTQVLHGCRQLVS
jgi:hypothetical protein